MFGSGCSLIWSYIQLALLIQSCIVWRLSYIYFSTEAEFKWHKAEITTLNNLSWFFGRWLDSDLTAVFNSFWIYLIKHGHQSYLATHTKLVGQQVRITNWSEYVEHHSIKNDYLVLNFIATSIVFQSPLFFW